MKRARTRRRWARVAAVVGAVAAFVTLQSFGADLVRYMRIKTM